MQKVMAEAASLHEVTSEESLLGKMPSRITVLQDVKTEKLQFHNLLTTLIKIHKI